MLDRPGFSSSCLQDTLNVEMQNTRRLLDGVAENTVRLQLEG